MNADTWADALQDFFAGHANPAYAGRMSSYMLNQFDYFGIAAPLRKKLTASFTARYGLPSAAGLDETVRLVWQKPQRELQYAIMEIASRKAFLADDHRIKLYEYMITTHSWWDTVDFIAANAVGGWMLNHRGQILRITRDYMDSGNMWLQRTSLLFQLKYRSSTDHQLLFAFINELSGSDEFFIRKAIGWALRELSKRNPEVVMEFVNTHELSNLSKREALRIIHKNQSV